jgi:hypothetical protein
MSEVIPAVAPFLLAYDVITHPRRIIIEPKPIHLRFPKRPIDP